MQIITRQQLPRAAKVLAEQFVQDPLYKHILPDETTRLDVLNIFFKNYLELLYPYSDIYTTSDRLEAVGVLFRSERYGSSFRAKLRYISKIAAAVFKSLPACRYIGVKGFLRGLGILNNMSSAWLEMLGDREYIHLDMLAIQQPYRGKGYATRIMKPMLEESSSRGIPLTLETQNPDNLPKYEHYGFKVVDVLALQNSKLEMYCMVHES